MRSAHLLPDQLWPPALAGYAILFLSAALVTVLVYRALLALYRQIALRRAAPLPPPTFPGWLTADPKLDEHYQQTIGEQLAELTAYRSESYQLVAFAAAIAGATTAIKTSHGSAQLIGTLAIFALVLAYEGAGVVRGRAAPRSVDPFDVEKRFAVSAAIATSAGVSQPTAVDVQQELRVRSRQAYDENTRSIARRRVALRRMRILLGIAVVLFIWAAVDDSGSEKSSSTPIDPHTQRVHARPR